MPSVEIGIKIILLLGPKEFPLRNEIPTLKDHLSGDGDARALRGRGGGALRCDKRVLNSVNWKRCLRPTPK